MSPFAGIVCWSYPPASQGIDQPLRDIIARRSGGRPRTWLSRHALFVAAELEPPLDGDHAMFVADARLDNRQDIAAGFGAGASVADAALVRSAFLSSGDRGIASLLGAFAFAHWDERTCRLTLARDCLGLRPLFYHRGGGFVAFASYLPDLLAIPGVPCAIDETMAAKFLSQDHHERERTLYRGIDRVASRSRVVFSPDAADICRYWAPRLDAPPPYVRDEDYIERGRELFDRAVARCLRDSPRVAILTSGGLDSSAVAATAALEGKREITCFTGLPPENLGIVVPPTRYIDERPNVEALVRMYPRLRVRFVIPRGMHLFYENCSQLFDLQALPAWGPVDRAWFDAIEDAVAADGHCVVLDGAEGNFGLSWTGSFSLPVLARQGRYAALLREARAIARFRRQSLKRVLREELAGRSAPRALRRLITRLGGGDPDRLGPACLLDPGAVDALDLRRHWKDDLFDPRFRLSGDSQRIRADLAFDKFQITRDIRAMSRALRGYDVRDPHADRELLQFCLAVPETLYRRDGVPRWFARRVFADRLPPEILQECRRGAQSANWFEALNARKPIFRHEIADIEASQVASRLIDVPRLKRLFAEWPADCGVAAGRAGEYRYALDRACHLGQFVKWVEGRSA